MSLKSWCAEFYPIPACEVPEDAAIAVDHSLQKWIGLRPENLAKHGVSIDENGNVQDDETDDMYNPVDTLLVSSKTCALCEHFFNFPKRRKGAKPACCRCPLAIVRGAACDEKALGETCSPYQSFKSGEAHDPDPMIQWLQKAKEFVATKPVATGVKL